MRYYISLLVAVLAMSVSVDMHAADDELEQYIASEACEREDIDVTCADSYYAGKALDAIEGVWRISGSEGMFAVVADSGTIFYKLIVVDSPDRNLLPGTVMGACTAAGRKDTYDARIFTSDDAGVLSRPKRFTITLSEDDRLIIVPVTNKFKLNLWRFLPYMFRMSVTRVNDRPNNLDGAIRIYPESQSSPLSPRYL